MYVGNQITAKKNRLLAIVWHTLIIFPLIIVMECKRLKIWMIKNKTLSIKFIVKIYLKI